MPEENNVNHGVVRAGPPCVGIYAADEGNSGIRPAAMAVGVCT
jgi:hypothetical protein